MDMGNQVRLKRNSAARARRIASNIREPSKADALEQASQQVVRDQQQQTEKSGQLRRNALRRHLRFLSQY